MSSSPSSSSPLAACAHTYAGRLQLAAWLTIGPSLVWILLGWPRLEDLLLEAALAVVGAVLLLASIVPLILAAIHGRERSHRRVLLGVGASLGVVGLLGLVGQSIASHNVLEWIWARAIDHSWHPDCVVPLFQDRRAYLLLPWLGLAFLGQSHGVELLVRRWEGARLGRSGWVLGSAWLLGLAALAFGLSAGVARAMAPRIVQLELMAAAPLIAMVVIELAVRVLRRIPELPEAAPGAATLRFASGLSPDPAALAQGRRLLRIAGSWRVPIWLGGAVAALLVAETLHFGCGDHQAIVPVLVMVTIVVVLAVAGGIALIRVRNQGRRLTSEVDPAQRADSALILLLAHVEHTASRLEHDNTEAFTVALEQLPHLVDGLSTEEVEALERKGVEPRRLCRQLFDAWEPGQTIDPATRRALHHQLRRFVARARGEQERDPYRAQLPSSVVATGLGWLTGGRSPFDRRLRVTWWQVILAASGLALLGFCFAGFAVVVDNDLPLSVCMPGIAGCRFALELDDLAEGLGWLLAATPILLWFATGVVRRAGQRSLELALPPRQTPLRRPVTPRWYDALERQRRALILGNVVDWIGALVVVVVLPGLAALLADDASWYGDVELALVWGPLVGLGLVVCQPLQRGRAALTNGLWRAWLRVSARGRPELEVLASLAKLRGHLASVGPDVAVTLDRIAAKLDALAELRPSRELDDVARTLELATARGAALSQLEREELEEQLGALERLYSHPISSGSRWTGGAPWARAAS